MKKIKQSDIDLAIKEYKEGKISIGRASEIAGVCISEMMDILSNLGIESNLELGDYLEGKKVAERLF